MRVLRQRVARARFRRAVREHGFWFVDIPRTSSTSLRAELGRRCGPAYGKTNVLQKEFATPQLFFRDHTPAREMRELLGARCWRRIFTFTMVRNPWDRVHSFYRYRRKKGKLPADLGFTDYVRRLEIASPDSPYVGSRGARYGAADYLLDDDGRILVDFVGRFEDRERDLARIAQHLGWEDFGRLHLQAAAPPEHYSCFYTEETEAIVRRLHAKDIELFDYEFERGDDDESSRRAVPRS